jgi:hypothetical protein
VRVWNDTEDHTKEMKGDMNDKRKPQDGPRNNNTHLDKMENSKHQGSEGEQHIVRNKLKEDLHIT